MLFDADFWVLVSFFGFIGLALYFKAPARILTALDARRNAIARELEEAQKLREDAQKMLAQYQRRQQDAEHEVEAILEQARSESERLAMEIRSTMIQRMNRRTKMAEDKIHQAELHALADIRTLAAEVAVDTARSVIAETLDPARADALIDNSTQALRNKLH